ncbi:MAG: hypothetical protein K2X38_12200, partial [Gemmataceae bacterium]|nr:hypothetical protein [Gemmataceae bacterium]
PPCSRAEVQLHGYYTLKTVIRIGSKVSFAFLSCPFKYKPSDSPVDLLGREYRVIPETDADLFLFAIEASLRILHEARSR